MVKRRYDEGGLGSCISTDVSATSTSSKAVPMIPVVVKHRHDGGLGECVSEASATPHYMVPSTSYRYRPGGKMSLKTTVLGLTLPPKPVTPANPPSTSKLGPAEARSEGHPSKSPSTSKLEPAEAQSESNDLGPSSKQKRPRYDGDFVWLDCRDEFLSEFLRSEGRGEYTDGMCAGCLKEEGVYRCQNCMGMQLLCKGCIVQTHLFNPLHVIEAWTNSAFFQWVSLTSLGLVIRLGHKPTERCRSVTRVDPFTILDLNGFHQVVVEFCGCEVSKPHYIQLLRYGWYPASVTRPQTASTMPLLKFYHQLTLESKTNTNEFHNTLVRLTDNTGTGPKIERREALRHMTRQYRHLKSLKRAARGHKQGGVSMTKLGECAVLCPACPQPSLNMLSGWQLVSPERRYLNRMFIAMDANFRLRRRDVSSEGRDPSYSNGWSYFVPEAAYKSHLKTFDGKVTQNRSTCSNHQAVNAERKGKGLAATGVAAVLCARHGFTLAQAVGDLQKGERWVNMDFVFLSSLSQRDILHLLEFVVSYDVACQWAKYLWTRLLMYPLSLRFDYLSKAFTFLVPKFHLPAHVMKCQKTFSFNFTKGVGRTEGEAPERGWASLNWAAASTVEMGPGFRRDVMDDHLGDANWQKTCDMATSLAQKLKQAIPQAEEYDEYHKDWAMTFPDELRSQYYKALEAWENDSSLPNPFEKTSTTVSLQQVRKRLAERDAQPEKAYVLHNEVSASQMIIMGMEFEEQQRQLTSETKANQEYSSTEQATKLQNRWNALHRKISAWIDIQHLYMPGLHLIRQRRSPDESDTPACETAIYLPSAVLASGLAVACDNRLLQIELELRRAQADDALQELRDALRLRSHVLQDKARFQNGQLRSARAQSRLNGMNVKVDASAAKYRVTRNAIVFLAQALNDPVPVPRTLADVDVKAFNDDGDSEYAKGQRRKKAEGNKVKKKAEKKAEELKHISWIWNGSGEGDTGLQEDLRIELCKTKARADRWREEVELLREEMGRVKRFFKTRSLEWSSLASDNSNVSPVDQAEIEGRRAYALEQSAQFDRMYDHCVRIFSQYNA